MSNITLIATSAFGLEAVVGRELKNLGCQNIQVENGKVTFTGDEKTICRTNLWLRSSDRVLIKMGEFTAMTFDELFENTKKLPWEEWITENSTFPVEGKSIDSKLFSISDCQAIVKKAIVEKLKMKYKKEWFEESGPRVRVEVALLKDRATLTIDTSGAGLHKRGYRTLVYQAPIKETLAAAMIQISRWNKDRAFIDPLCGSGTLPIEAALIGRNIAPGLNRQFDAQAFARIPQELWKDSRIEAMDLINHEGELNIHGSDISEEAIRIARYHAEQAGVDMDIHLQRMDVADVRSKYKYGFTITNPPYGERISEIKEVEALYRSMRDTYAKLDTWSHYIFTSYTNFEKIFGKAASKKRKLFNGRILCNYYQFFGPPPPRVNREKVSLGE